MKKILVSSCLYGGRPVRYDGKSKEERDPRFLAWKAEGRLIPVCPEVMGGLCVPRPDAQRQKDRVVTRTGRDVTEEYMRGAKIALEAAVKEGAAFAILKEKSPSCGSRIIYDGTFSGETIPGQGITAELLRKRGIKVFSEEELDEAEEFLKKAEEENP
ncbi:MAG TPA: DUF523 domain-containing protein [Candidatus Copromorpha excrementigallinarum]|uniref:DUF523 domain-containing protein n=1 Tax=Candidatus Allocopromorpha excrementigallinarum TaxID=2840742 RepID=A0A9D1I1F3_9FIRM|nr:DUF523 domain-containing protein [Candidatus Copromorpha excrementigallinarum]